MIDLPNSDRLSVRASQYALSRALAQCSIYQLSHSISLLGKYLNHEPTVHDLTPETVNNWLASLEQTLAIRTIAGHRVNILGLWRYLAEEGVVPAPRQVRLVKKPDPCPVAWTIEELRELIAQAQRQSGLMCDGTPWSIYWEATIRTAYDTGLRKSDLWRLTLDQIRPDGSIAMVQHKTRRSHEPRVTQRTLELLRQVKHSPPLAWPDRNPRQWYNDWGLLVAAARIRPGALQQIRRTGATHLYKEHPEDVQRYLGHRTPTMQRHYVDLSLAAPQANMPPEL